ncbi:glycosyltransferase [Geminicoccaceae bacterium 1502E]|nr:glycosyltransferase [Geminicoccaceae bacterium 1502E]
MRILHVIPALVTGGAQMMLAKLLEAPGTPHQQRVVALCPGGGLWPRVVASGADPCDLGLTPGEISPRALLRLAALLRRWRPDVVHGWMYHGNLAALLASRLSGRHPAVLWNIRHSLHDLSLEKGATRVVIRASVPLSRLAGATVYNAQVSARQHQRHGYTSRDVEIIPNGFDTERFRPDPQARAALRSELGLAPATVLLGHAARYHPMKAHLALIRALGRLVGEGADVHLLMAGEGVTPANEALREAIAAGGIGGRVSLLGERQDMPRLLASLDLAVLCSAWGEGFPNVLGEAMACGVPCLATDVGDCEMLLQATGGVVPPGDAEALAAALGWFVGMPQEVRRSLGMAARERILQEFALPAVARRYDALYERLGGGA